MKTIKVCRTVLIPQPIYNLVTFKSCGGAKLKVRTEIVEDVKEECEKYGSVLDVKIPRPSMGSRQSAGVGKIYVKFVDAETARKALQNLAGRKFADRTVVTTYFSEVSSIEQLMAERY